jgi:hypothetical protein
MSLGGYSDRSTREFRRGGKAIWFREGTRDGDEILSNAKTIKNACHARRLFYAGVGQIPTTAKPGLIMGLGRDDVQAGEEVCALKGGAVLYALRRHDDMASVLGDGCGLAPMFSFVGEAYLHGFMDGEVLRYSEQQPTERPEGLREMGNSFENIYIK